MYNVRVGTLKWDSVGPGAYDPDALTTKYESCVSPIMPQRRSPRPRPRIENMERTVVQDRFDRGSTHAKPWVDEKIGPGKYNLHDDPRKIEFHKTIGLLPKKICTYKVVLLAMRFCILYCWLDR